MRAYAVREEIIIFYCYICYLLLTEPPHPFSLFNHEFYEWHEFHEFYEWHELYEFHELYELWIISLILRYAQPIREIRNN